MDVCELEEQLKEAEGAALEANYKVAELGAKLLCLKIEQQKKQMRLTNLGGFNRAVIWLNQAEALAKQINNANPATSFVDLDTQKKIDLTPEKKKMLIELYHYAETLHRNAMEAFSAEF
jgi:hypothetical protein